MERLDAAGGSYSMSKEVIEAYVDSNIQSTNNVNGHNASTIFGEEQIYSLKDLVLSKGFDLTPRGEDYKSWFVCLVSCGSEANTMFFRGCSDLAKKMKVGYNISLSATEHEASISTVDTLSSTDLATVTKLNTDVFGRPTIEHSKISNSAVSVLSCMQANNETGAITDVVTLAKDFRAKMTIDNYAMNSEVQYAYEMNKGGLTFVHCDMVQSFGNKLPIETIKSIAKVDSGVDAITITFHKIPGGAQGLACLLLRKQTILKAWAKMNICPTVGGNNIMNKFTHLEGVESRDESAISYCARGGTPSVPLVSAALSTLWYDIDYRQNDRYDKLRKFRNDTLQMFLNAGICLFKWDKMFDETDVNFVNNKFALVVMSPLADSDSHPGILLLTLIPYKQSFDMCNSKLKKYLSANNISISLSSVCKSTSMKSSHVMEAIGAEPFIKKGVHRLSWTDDQSVNTINSLIKLYFSFVDLMLRKKL